MTRSKTYRLTTIAAVLFVGLSWVFADGLFTGPLWNGEEIASSSILTYLLLAIIVIIGINQARALPLEGVNVRSAAPAAAPGEVAEPRFWQLLMSNTYLALIWLPIRFFVGREWLAAGEHKLRDPGWMAGGEAIRGYWQGAVAIPAEGRPAITYGWFRNLLQYMLDHGWHSWFAPLVAVGETLIGIGLLVGALVGIAAFFGTFLNFNFQLAGTASTNPVLFGLGVFLVLAWRVAGWWGLDRWLLPVLGTPWRGGTAFPHERATVAPGEQRSAPA